MDRRRTFGSLWDGGAPLTHAATRFDRSLDPGRTRRRDARSVRGLALDGDNADPFRGDLVSARDDRQLGHYVE